MWYTVSISKYAPAMLQASQGVSPEVSPMPYNPTTIPRVCEQCGAPFVARPILVSYGGARFCSRQCKDASQQRPLIDRFWERVDTSGNCWVWTSALDKDGYGRLWNDSRNIRAHRFAYEYFVGPIPSGFQIDHLCRNRACVNPAHLEVVTSRTNSLRGFGVGAINARKTHCKYGHPFDETNTFTSGGPGRRCRMCHSRHSKESKERRKGAKQA